jgi:Family of unknown function (DUF6356)
MMQMIERRFLAHPATVGETYGEHARFAAWFGSRLMLAGLAALTHAILPFAFETTASRQVKDLARTLSERAGRSH